MRSQTQQNAHKRTHAHTDRNTHTDTYAPRGVVPYGDRGGSCGKGTCAAPECGVLVLCGGTVRGVGMEG